MENPRDKLKYGKCPVCGADTREEDTQTLDHYVVHREVYCKKTGENVGSWAMGFYNSKTDNHS